MGGLGEEMGRGVMGETGDVRSESVVCGSRGEGWYVGGAGVMGLVLDLVWRGGEGRRRERVSLNGVSEVVEARARVGEGKCRAERSGLERWSEKGWGREMVGLVEDFGPLLKSDLRNEGLGGVVVMEERRFSALEELVAWRCRRRRRKK